MEEKKKLRRSARLEQTQQNIMNAFARVLARKGLAWTTMDDIAREAGFATGSLYNYFPSKEKLGLALADWLLQMFLDVLATPVPEGTAFPVRFRFIIERMSEHVRSNRELFFVFATLPRQFGRDTEESRFVIELHQQFHLGLVTLLEHGVREGFIPREKLDIYAVYFHGLAEGALLHWVMMGGDERKLGEFLDLVDFFLRGARE